MRTITVAVDAVAGRTIASDAPEFVRPAGLGRMSAPAVDVTFRSTLNDGRFIIAPGAYDGLTARMVEQASFDMVYMTGAGTAAALGYPDYGLLTTTEMVDNAAVIARSGVHPCACRRRHGLRERDQRDEDGTRVRGTRCCRDPSQG